MDTRQVACSLFRDLGLETSKCHFLLNIRLGSRQSGVRIDPISITVKTYGKKL